MPLQGSSLGGLSLTSYEVYWDAGAGGSPSTLYNETIQLFELFTGLTTGTTYQFAIAGKNELGIGAVSTVLTLVCATNPEIPAAPTTTIIGTNVEIAWTNPNNGGDNIISY